VLREACNCCVAWSRERLDIGVAVNVSAVQLEADRFVQDVADALAESGIEPASLTIEITETALMRDAEQTAERLRAIKKLGVRLSIDDFGTGYSSLGRLRQLTLDTLKIDRIFVDGVDSSEADRTVVEHIIGMAHTLGMRVVAEGVESEAQLQVLRSLDCDEIQGFLLSRPLDQQIAETVLLHHCLPADADPAKAPIPS
jgi:EAL domain-containing protein (putative c-di-GMP-specific phosphodiesterase class I)